MLAAAQAFLTEISECRCLPRVNRLVVGSFVIFVFCNIRRNLASKMETAWSSSHVRGLEAAHEAGTPGLMLSRRLCQELVRGSLARKSTLWQHLHAHDMWIVSTSWLQVKAPCERKTHSSPRPEEMCPRGRSLIMTSDGLNGAPIQMNRKKTNEPHKASEAVQVQPNSKVKSMPIGRQGTVDFFDLPPFLCHLFAPCPLPFPFLLPFAFFCIKTASFCASSTSALFRFSFSLLFSRTKSGSPAMF